MRIFELPPLTLHVVQGDIALRQVDAVVNAANNALWMGSGVAGAIKAKGGVEIERAAMALGPIEPGGSVLTHGGRAEARHALHAAAVGPGARGGGGPRGPRWRSAPSNRAGRCSRTGAG